jgi:hypothetical protein
MRTSSLHSLVRRSLVCHPRSPCPAVREVTIEVGVEPAQSIVARYRVLGDISRLRIPEVRTPLDPARLWAHTCCELFVAPSADDGYVEWNFSPTGQLARFDFVSYRRRGPSTGSSRAETTVSVSAQELRLEARAPLELGHGDSARLSLTAVIEDAAGELSYWALRHPNERPDFHHRGGFALTLTPNPSPMIGDHLQELP